MGIKGVPKPESIVTKATTSSEETATETGAAGKIAEKVGEAAEVIGRYVVLIQKTRNVTSTLWGT
jgi:FK506-binding protein 2